MATFGFTPAHLLRGNFVVLHQPLLATDSPEFDTRKFDGWAGFDLLGRRQAIIDFGSNTLWLR